MSEQRVAREAPIIPPLKDIKGNPSNPPATDEPVLAIENIQGNIISGFNKDQQTLLFLKVTDVENFRKWLGTMVPFIATAAEVLSFNRLFKEIRRRRKVETRTVQATWVNVALSFSALKSLTDDTKTLRHRAEKSFKHYQGRHADDFKADKFTDEAFKEGMQKRAIEVLSDPAKTDAEGNPNNWVFGGPDNEADVVVIVASDSEAELAAEVSRIEESIYSGRTAKGEHANSGVQIIYKQQGKTLPPPLTGHEHFGFLDGVSQPGLRGLVRDGEVLTPRQNPNNRDQGKPGQDLLWPGEFIFGYPQQVATPAEDGGLNKTAGPCSEAGPVWGKDGSFYVVRRLRQDVDRFHRFLDDQARELKISPELFGAKLVGRWKSGSPVMRKPEVDDEPQLGDNDCANNNFEFQEETEPIEPQMSADDPSCAIESADCVDNTFHPSEGDTTGATCPFASHIRKAYPRDDVTTAGSNGAHKSATGEGTLSPNESDTQTHRLLRRGIPFGAPFFPPNDPKRTDSGNRGLVFAAYQTSIIEQFEFVTKSWVNNSEFKDPTKDGELQSGHDLIIGQRNGPDGSRERQCRVTLEAQDGTTTDKIIKAPVDWVIPTGGGYFFAPSIDALCLLTGAERP